MIGPNDLFHPSPAPHFKTFQVFLICCPKRSSFSTVQSNAPNVAFYYFLPQNTYYILKKHLPEYCHNRWSKHVADHTVYTTINLHNCSCILLVFASHNESSVHGHESSVHSHESLKISRSHLFIHKTNLQTNLLPLNHVCFYTTGICGQG